MITYQSRVYFEDTDSAGVVYHANYLKWMERARTEALYQHGLDLAGPQMAGFSFVVSSLDMTFKRPLRLGQSFQVDSHIIQVDRCAYHWQQTVQDQDHLYCEGHITTVLLNASWRPTRLTPEIRSTLQPLESLQ